MSADQRAARRFVLALFFRCRRFRFLMIEPAYFLHIGRWLRQLEFHVLESVNDNLRYYQISELLWLGGITN
jgi:hypothetical protein